MVDPFNCSFPLKFTKTKLHFVIEWQKYKLLQNKLLQLEITLTALEA